jgi:16S rRNA C967 or C1407 C5-methylase (RsmB/RsmF family)
MMIEEIILKELAELKDALNQIKSGMKHLDERLRSTERLQQSPAHHLRHSLPDPLYEDIPEAHRSAWDKKIAEEEKKRQEELERVTALRGGQETLKKWLGEHEYYNKDLPEGYAERLEELGQQQPNQEGDPYEYAHPAFDYLQRAKKE